MNPGHPAWSSMHPGDHLPWSSTLVFQLDHLPWSSTLVIQPDFLPGHLSWSSSLVIYPGHLSWWSSTLVMTGHFQNNVLLCFVRCRLVVRSHGDSSQIVATDPTTEPMYVYCCCCCCCCSCCWCCCTWYCDTITCVPWMLQGQCCGCRHGVKVAQQSVQSRHFCLIFIIATSSSRSAMAIAPAAADPCCCCPCCCCPHPCSCCDCCCPSCPCYHTHSLPLVLVLAPDPRPYIFAWWPA